MSAVAYNKLIDTKQEKPTEKSKNIDFYWGAKIPMRDGIILNATLYKPQTSEPIPVVFTLTPYIADSYHERAYFFAQHDYAFALVDVRGRGNSEGEFEPLINEGRDGHDIVEWLAEQDWCNGSVAMWGGSYAGYDQWATLKEFPTHLRSIVPAAAVHPGVDLPFFKNIFFSYEIQWQTLTSGVTPNNNIFQEASFWIEKFRQGYLAHTPYKELDRVVGNTSSSFRTWVAHPTPDDHWDGMALSMQDYQAIDIPILSITGHYDGDQSGALEFYRRHMQWGIQNSRDMHFLIIGPWDHSGTRTPNQEVGGLEFGQECMLDMNKLHKEWYDWILKDGEKPEFLKERVAYYVMGADEWKYATDLDSIANKKMRLYLNSSDGVANDVFHSGVMQEQLPGLAQPDQYVYDPLDLRPEEIEREEFKNYLTDQRYALNLYGNGLVYHSIPFEKNTEVSGFVKLIVWISMDVPDTDFMVVLSEILLDGSQIQLAQDFLRARYRESQRQQKLVNPGEVNQYAFDSFTFFSRRIAKGSRLRLVICSPNSIYFQKNYNSGGVVAEESAKDARRAHITLYHDSDRTSYIELPVGK